MMQLEKGMNRHQDWQIAEDLTNQENARLLLEKILQIDVVPQSTMSIWDWEFKIDNYLLAIGEYRRRFSNFNKFSEFIFSKKKFDTLKEKSKLNKVPTFMFVEFNDQFLYFMVDGEPDIKTIKRKHENRTEECVMIPLTWFKNISNAEKDVIF
jgi:hypothetical protein